ncbi:MAG: hypothetical protein QXG02_04320 [Candidatus Anstonellales archaeon]
MNKQRCIWADASTNPRTGKAEMPEACKKRKCDGFQKEPLCENFIPVREEREQAKCARP